jgi:hypothetical protein
MRRVALTSNTFAADVGWRHNEPPRLKPGRWADLSSWSVTYAPDSGSARAYKISFHTFDGWGTTW